MEGRAVSNSRRNLDQGQRQQRQFGVDLAKWGLTSYPLGEEGTQDKGDRVLFDPAGHGYLLESKRTQGLAVRATLLKAERKAPEGHSAIVGWQPVRESDGGKRMADGLPLAILRWEELLALLSGQNRKARVS